MLLRVKRYVIALSIAGNQLANALSGGSPTETVSSRLGHARDGGSRPASAVCSVLNTIDLHHEVPGEDHCQKAVRHYRARIAADASKERAR